MIWRERNPQANISGVLRLLRATTGPGRYWTQTNPHPGGAAHLVWGQHIYKKGKHKGHPALVSAGGLDRVWRDRDGDFTQDADELVEEGNFGIHVHAGGTGESVGGWSAGCIAIHGGYDGEPYRMLLERVEKHPQKLFDLTLWGARDLARWVDNKDGWRPWLRFGIRNPWVADMQRLLNERLDCGLEPDGDWGARTQGAFLRFQRQSGLEVDGVCGRRSWAELEKRDII